MTKRIILDGSDERLKEAVAAASEALAVGGVILYPTDTVYGLGGDSLNRDAIERIQKIKGRNDGKPMHSIVADIETAEWYGEVNKLAHMLAEKFLPGPLTILLKRSEEIPEWVVNGSDYFGIRIPDSDFCIGLAQAFGRAYTSTSANVTGEGTGRSIDAILEQLGERAQDIDLIIDSGELPASLPSTVVNVAYGKIEIVREGAISRESLQDALKLI